MFTATGYLYNRLEDAREHTKYVCEHRSEIQGAATIRAACKPRELGDVQEGDVH